jgi:amino acid permease
MSRTIYNGFICIWFIHVIITYVWAKFLIAAFVFVGGEMLGNAAYNALAPHITTPIFQWASRVIFYGMPVIPPLYIFKGQNNP